MKYAVLALATFCLISPAALAEPVALSDLELDSIAAGSQFKDNDGPKHSFGVSAPKKDQFAAPNGGKSSLQSNVNFTSQVATSQSVAVVECIGCVVNSGGTLTLSAVAISSSTNINQTQQRNR